MVKNLFAYGYRFFSNLGSYRPQWSFCFVPGGNVDTSKNDCHHISSRQPPYLRFSVHLSVVYKKEESPYYYHILLNGFPSRGEFESTKIKLPVQFDWIYAESSLNLRSYYDETNWYLNKTTQEFIPSLAPVYQIFGSTWLWWLFTNSSGNFLRYLAEEK